MIKQGDILEINNKKYNIKEIISQEHYRREGYFLEFYDENGKYHYWKEYIDGGKILNTKKRLYDYFGEDCTDIFEKYGYKI